MWIRCFLALVCGFNGYCDGTRHRSSAMKELRFDVFGKVIAVNATLNGWRAFILGADGKRRAADFPIPSTLTADEMTDYLDDLFHEFATPVRLTVRKLQPFAVRFMR